MVGQSWAALEQPSTNTRWARGGGQWGALAGAAGRTPGSVFMGVSSGLGQQAGSTARASSWAGRVRAAPGRPGRFSPPGPVRCRLHGQAAAEEQGVGVLFALGQQRKSWALALMVSRAPGAGLADALPTPAGCRARKALAVPGKSRTPRGRRAPQCRSLRRSRAASAGRWRARARFSAVTSSTEPG